MKRILCFLGFHNVRVIACSYYNGRSKEITTICRRCYQIIEYDIGGIKCQQKEEKEF